MRPIARLIATGMLLVPAAVPALNNTSCHIHPPGSTPRDPLNTIGPFDTVRHCEQVRAEYFGALGRCHCNADFTPDWRLLMPDTTFDRQPLP